MRCKDRVLFSKFSLCCLFFLKLEMTSSAHGRGTLCVLLQKLDCLAARYTLQALHLSTCAHGAGIHGDVLTGHTKGRAVSSPVLLTKFAHVGSSRASEVHQRNQWILPIFSLRTGREQPVSESSNHSLYLTKLFRFSNPEGHCGECATSTPTTHTHTHNHNTQQHSTPHHTNTYNTET